jgi:phosphoribosyl 1,2-cyclic phosphate phosphodiesterase
VSALSLTILGCGSSGGVPRADGNWGACDPNEPKNRRTRCSLLVRRYGGAPEPTTVLVDTSPDLRVQTVAAGATRLDAVLFTHDHADQTHGIDDVRPFFIRHRRRVPAWMDAFTAVRLTRRFDYVFKDQVGYPAILDKRALPPHGTAWSVEGPGGPVPVTTFDQIHGDIRSVGYRFGDAAYSSDVSDLDEAALNALRGLKLWIVDALRWTPHPTHAHVDKTLAWIEVVKPERAVLTNLHVDLDYRDLARRLPDGVEPAYDGMTVDVPLSARYFA